MVVAILWFVGIVVVLLVAGSAAWAGWRAAPYVPTRTADVQRMLRLAKITASDVIIDLGAGDGRFLLAAADHVTRVIGYEISILPLLIARWRLRRRHLANAQIYGRDFFRVDLSAANVIVCFLTPPAMRRLGPKFQRELHPGTRIVSYAFPIASWVPVVKDKPDARTMAIYLYTIPPELEH